MTSFAHPPYQKKFRFERITEMAKSGSGTPEFHGSVEESHACMAQNNIFLIHRVPNEDCQRQSKSRRESNHFSCAMKLIIIIIVTSFAPISSKIKLSGATKPGD